MVMGNLGLSEMKIVAGYLHKKSLRDIGLGKENITKGPDFIIRATVSPIGTLAYEFNVLKPKEVRIICKEDIQIQQDEFIKNSIYFFNGEPNKEAEFLVFFDDIEDNNFINALHNSLLPPKNRKSYLDDINDYKKKLKLSELNEVDYIKILIEKYSSRLFVVINTDSWKNNDTTPLDEKFWKNDKEEWLKSKFLYKRICWIERTEFIENLNLNEETLKRKIDDNFDDKDAKINKFEYFKLYLYSKWVNHLSKRLKGININDKENILTLGKVFYDINRRKQTTYDPDTLPGELKRKIKIEMEQRASYERKFFNFETQVKKYIKCFNDVDRYYVLYTAHNNAYVHGSNGWYNQLSKSKNNSSKPNKIYFSGSLSGKLIYWPIIHNMETLFGSKYNVTKFDLCMIENGLLNIGIVDERTYRWFLKIGKEQNMGISLQEKIFPATIDRSTSRSSRMVNGITLLKDNTNSTINPYDITFSTDDMKLYISINNKKDDLGKIFIYGNNISNCKIQISIDILIMHQGIIDKAKDERLKTPEFYMKLKDEIPFFVITSGRGPLEKCPELARFMPFSIIQNSINTPYIEKFMITKKIF